MNNFPVPQDPKTMHCKTNSPRPSEEVDLCVAAIRKIQDYLTGVDEWAILDARRAIEEVIKIHPSGTVRSLL